MTTAVKRACDACHRRKVKCDGIKPCRNCSASQLGCTYNAIPQKKGPKGSRAKVINELKETQRQTTLSGKLQNGPPISQSLAPTPRLLTKETINACVEFFFAHLYPTMPILDRQRLEHDIMYMDQNIDSYCLLASLCSFVSLQPGMTMPSMGMPAISDPFNSDMMFGGNILASTLLMEEAIRVRKGEDHTASRSLNTLCTDFFLFAVHHGLDMHDKAWFYLREATTFAHLSRMNEEPQYMQYDNADASRCRRLYWLLFVTERAYALQHRRPLTLEATINLPSPTDPGDPLPHHLPSFLRQIQLFHPFDHSLVSLWMKTKGECTEAYLTTLEKQLQDVVPPYLNDTQNQLSEMQVNLHWLKDVSWKLGLANGTGHDAGLSYSLPQNEINQLLPMVSHFPGNLGLQGFALLEKLLTITSDLAEVLAVQPAPRTPFTPGPQDQLRKILNIVTVLRSGNHHFLPLLLSKVHAALPKMASPMLQNAPESAAPACNIDIFDGFGNAGMGQASSYSHDDYDNKFAVPRLDDMSSDSNSPNGGPPSSRDMSSPFVSSPGIMSPGIEIPHGLQTDFTSMPEMVMSPISHAPPSSLGTPGGMNNPQQHGQHLQHTPLSPFPTLGSQMQGLSSHNINPPPNINLASHLHLNQGLTGALNSALGSNMMARPPPQRANSFALGPPPIRTVGDFQALQRTNSDLNPMSPMSPMGPIGMNSMGAELDFNTLPR